ncbi:PQQ-binding-like beta-propeller repeat protein [Candidatus Rariloculus sp.]|uniref:outer membrane protein assembly factor BamB family protein n=1 Tax=Candidatus Rariloculus sp. TaxID=3101265 RepID=UPI003D0BB81E
MRNIGILAAAIAAVGSAASAQDTAERGPAAVDEARLLAANAEPGNWLSYGRTYDEQRYSPLDQVTTGNIGELGLAWFADIPLNRGQESTPIVVDGVIYLSSSWSNVFAYDAATGEQLWRYDPEVPREWAINVCCGMVNRGVAAWNGRIYVGTLDGRLVAIDAATGEEVWDVYTIDRNQRYSTTGAVRVVKGRVLVGNSGGEFGVRGYVSAYDAETGELISADAFAPVNWASHVDLATGRPVENLEARYDDTGQIAFVTPTGRGAHNWQPMSFNPNTGLVYFGSRHSMSAYLADPDFTPTSIGTNTGTFRAFSPEQRAEVTAREDALFADRGALLGWDPVARGPAWRYVDPRQTGNGGTLSTAGNLVFAGGGEGQFFAYRADGGERLWTFDAHTGVAAGPVSYEVDGEQYIAVAAGRGLQPYYQPNYARLLAFKLGGARQLPDPVEYVAPALDPPPSTASADVIAHGADRYGQICVQCHNNRLGTFPDLRRSVALADAVLFDAIVLDGALAANGMASFAEALTPEDATAVREYVITLAIEAKAAEDAEQAAAAAQAAEDAEPHED